MDALLILGGLLLILAGLVWLVMLAFGTSLLWGIGSLLPPLTLFYVLSHWRTARKALALSALGFIPLIVGLTMLAKQDSERLEAILSLSWLQPEAMAPNDLAIQLRGELNGQPFAPRHGELIDGTLSLREGQDFFANREISIRLPQPVDGPLSLDVLPQDSGKKLPEVEVSWLLPEQELPEARRLTRGYTLHLDLKPQPPNKLVGDFHLVLPAQFKTALSGTVELFTDRLRYQDGKVDTHYDSQDTLAYVIEDYLQRRFATRDVELLKLPPVTWPATALDLEVKTRIDGQEQTLPMQLSKTPSRGWVVPGDRFPPLREPKPRTDVAASTKAAEKAPERVTFERVSRPLDRRPRFSLERLLRTPSLYQNLSMRVQTERGSTAEGRFIGISDDGRVQIRRKLNGHGEASFSLQPSEISKIELLEP